MKIFSQAPFVRFLLPFLAGIITAIYLPYQTIVFGLLTIILLACLVSLFSFKVFAFAYKWRWIGGFIITLLFYLLGYQLTVLKTDKYNTHHFSNYLDSNVCCRSRVIKMPVEKEKSIKVTAEIISVKQNGKWENAMGKGLIYFQKDDFSKKIKYGDHIFFKATFGEINSPQNPGEFDYKTYLAYRNINYQAYIKSGSWFNSKLNDGNFLISYALSLREKLLDVFKENNIEGDEYAVGSALILGYEDKLDADIIGAYSATGALHVLSVSGLHVAIVFIVFNWLLGFLDKVKKGNVIKAVLLILLIWFYALLTGLSPSVLRSATMFTFIIMGKSFNRYTNIYNTLAASCFLLLLVDPYLIMDVGFQLSYLAVLGIVIMQPGLYNLWEPDNWLLDQIWQITSVSIAAQLMTFPLGLFYFHQFPNYFLLSNLIVIPLSTLVLYSGILLFSVSKIKIVASIIATVLKHLIFFLNESVRVMEHFPYAIVQGISISILEAFLIYTVLVFVILFLVYYHARWLRYSLLSAILLLFMQCIESFIQQSQKRIIIYNLSNTSAFDFIDGKQNVFYADSSIINNENGMRFHVKQNWADLGIESTVFKDNKNRNQKSHSFFVKEDYIQFYNKKIVVVSPKLKLKYNRKLKIDYLILSGNTEFKIADLILRFDFDRLIIDSSNSRIRTEKWISEAKELNVNYYAVIHSGAFQVSIQ